MCFCTALACSTDLSLALLETSGRWVPVRARNLLVTHSGPRGAAVSCTPHARCEAQAAPANDVPLSLKANVVLHRPPNALAALLEPPVDTPSDYGFPEDVRIPYSERDDVETVAAAPVVTRRKKKKLVSKKRKKQRGKRQN